MKKRIFKVKDNKFCLPSWAKWAVAVNTKLTYYFQSWDDAVLYATLKLQ